MICAFGFVVFAQPLSQAMDLDPRNGILSGIEAHRAIEHLNRDVIFLDLVGFACEILRAKILQQTRQPWRTHEGRRLKYGLDLGP